MSKKILKTTLERDYYHVRFRQPNQFEDIRTPDWAQDIAHSESKGSKARIGKTSADNWLVQSVLISKNAGGKRYAKKKARKIQEAIDND